MSNFLAKVYTEDGLEFILTNDKMVLLLGAKIEYLSITRRDIKSALVAGPTSPIEIYDNEFGRGYSPFNHDGEKFSISEYNFDKDNSTVIRGWANAQ